MTIGFIIPEYFSGSGGHHRIFEFAGYISNFYETAIFVNSSNHNNIDSIFSALNAMDIKHNLNIKLIHELEELRGSLDIVFATHYSTVYIAKKNIEKYKKLFYFVQDYEPYFNPMSEEYIRADLSYLIPDVLVCFNKWVYNKVKTTYSRQLKDKEIFWLPFYINRKIFYYSGQPKKDNLILFFARPEMDRRLFNLGLRALELVYSLNPNIEIALFGSNNINSEHIRFPHINYGVLNQNELAELYRSSQIGLTFNTTNPSMTPYEMMACGVCVVDIDYNDNSINYNPGSAVLAKPDEFEIAKAIIDLTNNKRKINMIMDQALAYIHGLYDDFEVFGAFLDIINDVTNRRS